MNHHHRFQNVAAILFLSLTSLFYSFEQIQNVREEQQKKNNDYHPVTVEEVLPLPLPLPLPLSLPRKSTIIHGVDEIIELVEDREEEEEEGKEKAMKAAVIESRTTKTTSPTTAAAAATTTHTATTTTKTFALLYPTGLIGGYRNQVMRFIAFCKHTMGTVRRGGDLYSNSNNTDHRRPHLLLPSLVFSTRYYSSSSKSRSGKSMNNFFWPVLMEDLFDVDYWNQFTFSVEGVQVKLPLLIPNMSTTTHQIVGRNNH